MKVRYLVAMAAALSISATAFANDGEDAFKKSGCTTCHSVTAKALGPSMKSVADKYRGDAEAQAKLEKKVRNGGSGSFGGMPMPATAKSVSDESIKSIVSWALSQK